MMAARDRARFDYEVAYVLSAESALAADVAATGVVVHDLGARGNWDLTWLSRLRQLLRRGRFDLVHFHLPYAAAVGRLGVRSLAGGQRPRVVYTEHSIWGRTALPVRVLNRAGIGSDDAVIAVSEAARRALPGAVAQRATVVVHGIDQRVARSWASRRAQQRAALCAELGLGPDVVVVTTVANLRPEKGYEVLLAAARLVVDHTGRVVFLAVGRGPLAQEMESRRRALGIDDRFRFLGQREDALGILAGSDVFVLASHHEGMPVALMEAASVGLPIVATAVGEIPAAFPPGSGALLVPPGDAPRLASAIRLAVEDEQLRARLARASMARSELFDVRRAARSVEGVYGMLVGLRA